VPGQSGPGFAALKPPGRALATTSPGERYSEKEPFECGSLSPSPCSSSFLSNRSLFMIARITEEEIRRLLKERCYAKLMNK
jgi:hypothetical protein